MFIRVVEESCGSVLGFYRLPLLLFLNKSAPFHFQRFQEVPLIVAEAHPPPFPIRVGGRGLCG